MSTNDTSVWWNNNITIENIEYGEKITITLTSIKESYEVLKQNYNLIENSKITNENIVINV